MSPRPAHILRRACGMVRAGATIHSLRRTSDEAARKQLRARLGEILGEARGIAMKAGQLLATDSTDDGLRDLVTSVEPLPLSQVRPALEHAYGGDLTQRFTTFEESQAAASLGQVHEATLRSGERVAVKVRYPQIAEAVESELALIGLLPGVGPVRKWGFDLAGYKRVIADNMANELDYRSEAARQARFAAETRVTGLVVPRVVSALCRESVLVQSWEPGEPLSSARTWSKRERLELGRTLLETLFQSVFVTGHVHADPHPGNYRVRPGTASASAQLVLYDFGCTVGVPDAARHALLSLIVRLREGLPVDPLASFAALGFDRAKLEPLAPAMHVLCAALFRPFLVDGSFRTTDWELSAAVELACGELKWWFRSSGPPELLLLMRAFQGAVGHLESLDVALPWWPLLARMVGEDELARARDAGPSSDPSAATASPARASYLKVVVRDARGERARLTMPAREALRLREIVPDEVQARIRARGVELCALERKIARSGVAPGRVFDDEADGMTVAVWLE